MGTVAILNSLGFGEFIFHGAMNGLKYKFIYSYLFLTVYCSFFSSMVLLFLVDCFLFCFSLILSFLFLADLRGLLAQIFADCFLFISR